jgi:hypothetical protein
MIAEAVRARPARETPLAAVRGGFGQALATVRSEELEVVRQRTALILSVPALRTRTREQQDSLVEHLAEAVADRESRRGVEVDAQVIAAAVASAVSIAVERWAAGTGELPALVDDALAALGRLGTRSSR